MNADESHGSDHPGARKEVFAEGFFIVTPDERSESRGDNRGESPAVFRYVCDPGIAFGRRCGSAFP
jgi:hypothetical protein